MSSRRRSHLLMAPLAAGLIAGSIGMNLAHASTTLAWSKVGDGFNLGGSVLDLAVSANDDTLYAGGSFQSVVQQSGATLSVDYIAQWRAGDDSWLPMGKGVNDWARAVTTSADHTVYVGGNFDFATQRTDDTVALNLIGRWRSSDDTWLPMGGGLFPIRNGAYFVDAVAVSTSQGNVYAGGSFTSARQRTGESLTLSNVGRWRSSDDTWLPMGKGLNSSVRSVAVDESDDTVYVGGDFTSATQRTDDTIVAGRIAQWRASDDTWLPMGGRGLLATGVSPYVNDIEVVGNLVYVVGRFGFACNAIGDGSCSTAANGAVVAYGVAVYNTSTGLWSAVGSSPWSTLAINSIISLPGSQLLVATATSAGSASLYLWNGTSWSEVGTVSQQAFGPSVRVDAVATDDTNVYVGGSFDTIGPVGGPMNSINSLARGVFGAAPSPTPTPTPSPVHPPDAPTEVVASAGVEEALVSWKAPVYVGSFPITDYQVVSSPGAKSCLVKAPALSCTVSGLTAGTSYTFTARALNGAGWGAYSQPSNAVTPTAPVRPSILITGSRDASDSGRIQVSGTSTGLVGERVTPFVRFPGQTSASEGTGVQTVAADGTFAWGRKTGKKTYVYFQHGTTRSNTVVIPAR